MLRSSAIAALAISLLASSTTVFAQSGIVDPTPPADRRVAEINSTSTSIRRSVDNYDFIAHNLADAPRSSQTPTYRPGASGSGRAMSRRVWGGIVGAIGGAALGAYLGGKVGNDCGCGDPAPGALLGIPIGGVIGGVIGAIWF